MPICAGPLAKPRVIAKRDHKLIGPLAQRLLSKMNNNKFKANTVLAIKLARAVYFMLKNKTVFDPERLVRRSPTNDLGPGRRQPGRLTGYDSMTMPHSPPSHTLMPPSIRCSVLGTSAIRRLDWDLRQDLQRWMRGRIRPPGPRASGSQHGPGSFYLAANLYITSKTTT